MKKIFILIFLLLMVLYLYSEEEVKKTTQNDESFSYYLKVNSLIDKNLFKNKDEIFEYSQNLNNEQILLLQKKYQKNFALPLVLNSFIGFGSGNFACGDMVGGGIHAGIDGLAALSLLSIQFITLRDMFSLPGSTSQEALDSIDRRLKILTYVVYPAAGLMVINRIASLITASLYVKRYNRTLNEVLIRKPNEVSFRPVPIISPKGVGLALHIRL